jgi:hypothetical protein
MYRTGLTKIDRQKDTSTNANTAHHGPSDIDLLSNTATILKLEKSEKRTPLAAKNYHPLDIPRYKIENNNDNIKNLTCDEFESIANSIESQLDLISSSSNCKEVKMNETTFNTNKNINKDDKEQYDSNLKLVKKFKLRVSNRVILNVGGAKHEVLWTTLESLPKSRLGKLSFSCSVKEINQLCDDYNPAINEFYFDRHPRSFSTIIDLYRTGKLHVVEDVCVISFRDDLSYWGINEFHLETCCQARYNQRKDAILEDLRIEKNILKFNQRDEELFVNFFPKIRKKVWETFEYPDTSLSARVNI